MDFSYNKYLFTSSVPPNCLCVFLLSDKCVKSFPSLQPDLAAFQNLHCVHHYLLTSSTPRPGFIIIVPLTDCCAIFSHNALHRSDDLLHHRRRHGGGIDRTVGMGAQVLDKLLKPADTQEINMDEEL